MIHIQDRLLLEPQLSHFRALAMHRCVVLLLLVHCCGGQPQVIGQPIVAMVGDDIILPCYLETAVDATVLTVEWARPDLEPRFVLLRRDGVLIQHEDNPLYVGRKSLSTNKLKRGDISMTLSEVKLSDAGTYRCFVPESGTESFVELIVGSVSSPEIDIYKASNGFLLECKCNGWYPEPEVLWLDAEGNLLSAGPTETVRGPDDLYTVSSRVTVEKRHSNSFTCRVQQKNTNQTRETHISLSADLFKAQSSSAIRISICLAVCIVAVVAVVVALWKWGQNKKTTDPSTELQLLMEGDEDRQKPRTEREKIVFLDKTKVKLEEDLQNNEGELQHVQQVITTLMDQKKDLKNQREKLTSQQQENKTKIEEYKKKKTPKTDKDNKMRKREITLHNLEKRENEHKELLQNTEKLLESTEEMINKMTERKGKLERDKEKLNKLLKETEREREEIEKKLQSEQSEREEEINHPMMTA
ncbi:butyrophilin subfamily 3 member A2-like [Anoplopoma fimbria]|uniref:butyrophilin subfamily 3 member A2-like n=1 Tax=Anoplopoma fimbria TaxID=229290 RepID=UPI0023ECC7EC|nr:butyrophilin subfamily 3 member A2-like [Anoplopoma fimbria]